MTQLLHALLVEMHSWPSVLFGQHSEKGERLIKKIRIAMVTLVLVLVNLLLLSQVVMAQDPDEAGCCMIGYGGSKCTEATRDICTNIYQTTFVAGGHCQNNRCVAPTIDVPEPHAILLFAGGLSVMGFYLNRWRRRSRS